MIVLHCVALHWAQQIMERNGLIRRDDVLGIILHQYGALASTDLYMFGGRQWQRVKERRG
jgi:hypothetical protein